MAHQHLMRMSTLYAPTLKEVPAEAELISHQLLLRAGMIRKHAAGLYTYLPLAWRSLKKIEQIVREEMDATGAQELLLPIMQSGELWHESGRWDVYGPELMRLNDRHDRAFCLGPTHEEIITDLVRNELRTYKALPVTLYQIQTKFRDEMRPRFGLLRGREFIMKDAYSFHATQESLMETYEAMGVAYERVCERLGLDYRPVVADPGQIGGSATTEYMAIGYAGENELLFDDAGYAANAEAATALLPPYESFDSASGTCELMHTPGVTTIEELATFLSCEPAATVKALAVKDAQDQIYLLLTPGSHAVNELKVERLIGSYEPLTPQDFAACSLPVGYIGPVNLPDNIRVIADVSLENRESWVVGANQVDHHLIGARRGVDFEIDEFADIMQARAGDIAPESGEVLRSAYGTEVSQIFALGTKYSQALNATFANEQQKDTHFEMGCYGIGVSRSLAAVVEQYHDERGITWPISVAPYEVAVIPLSHNDDLMMPTALQIAEQLTHAGVEVVLDDRNERPGVKFADADLIGYPYQIVCGKRSLADGQVELKCRQTGERELVDFERVVALLSERVEKDRSYLSFEGVRAGQ